MVSIPKTSAHFSTSLANKITSSAASMTVVSGTDKAGNALSGLYGWVVDRGSASEEFMLGTISGTTVTITARGLDPGDGKTEVASLKLSHRRGATVEITDYPLLAVLLRVINADETIPNKLSYTSHPSFTATTEIVDKQYVDGVAIAGAPDASTTTKGVTKMSVAPASAASPIAVGDNDTRVPTAGQAAALPSTTTPAASNLYMTQKDFQKGVEIGGSTTGSANAYVFTPSPAIAAYAAGMTFRLKANFANSGAATLNVSGLGAVAIKKLDGATALVSGDIASGQEFVVIYDGTNFQMVSPVGNAVPAATVRKVGSTTYDVSTASGTQTIAHGLGKSPTKVRMTYIILATAASQKEGIGVWDGTTTKSITKSNSGAANAYNSDLDSSNIIHGSWSNASDTANATITVDATNITLTWTKAGTPTGTLTIIWEAEA